MNYEKDRNIPWEDILPFVEKPGRYLGGEVHSRPRDRGACRLSFALAFPDTYEVGMSHLGIQILYALLNNRPDVAAERFFAPWPDMEAQMRQEGIPLLSLESRTPLAAFDIVGFSLQYEGTYTNVLNMLDLGGIPLYAKDRRGDSPLVIAGGPCAFNPAPLAPFLDAVVIGEGEEVITEIAAAVMEAKEKGRARAAALQRLAGLEGVYVPSLHRSGEKIRKRTVPDLNDFAEPLRPIIPLIRTIHDRVNLEIARGCTRGCRFCQAGMVWRPVRERRPEILKTMAGRMIASTGCDEISLLSLSSGDYSRIEDLLTGLMNRHQADRVAVGLPSLRVETLTPRLIEEIKRVRKTSFTLAPEAGTGRLRNIINKGNSAEDLIATTRHVFAAGWRSVKLYFMLGLPGEREEDLDGMVDLALRVLQEGGKKRQVTVSVSTFVPKPHTPFQWAGQISLSETLKRQAHLKARIAAHRNLVFKWHDARMSLLEGILSRGDETLAALLERAFRLGCRFDGWSDRFRFDLWERALEDLRMKPETWLRERDLSEPLPWDPIDCGVRKEFLIEEWEKSLRGERTEDCRSGPCSHCGVCSGNIGMITVPEQEPQGNGPEAGLLQTDPPPVRKKWRIRFARTGASRFLSHLETSAALVRAIRQAGVSFTYSEGFHPHPRISFASALPVGLESRSEYADIQIEDPGPNKGERIERINTFLPAGLRIVEAEEIPFQGPSLSDMIKGYYYEISLAGDQETGERIRAFLASESFRITRESKGRSVVRDIRPLVDALTMDEGRRKVHVSVNLREGGGLRPLEILTRILGLDEERAKKTRIVKTGTFFESRA